MRNDHEISEIGSVLSQIETFVKSLSEFTDFPKNHSLFTSLVRSSLIKNYEFLKFVYLRKDFEDYFFLTSFLRGITEDIIVLGFISRIDPEKREKLLRGMQLFELNEKVAKQWDFFQKYRPFQPVFNRVYSADDAKTDLQSIWREMGWPNFEVKSRNVMPPVIQLAQKLAPGVLDILYEFIYRLSSSTVHFSPQTLLKMAWGNISGENDLTGTISVKHMANYHKSFCGIYGSLLFTFYFEFFANEITASDKEQSIVASIRKVILEELRWPEMVTFEEMNQAVPPAYHDQIIAYGLVHQLIIEELKNGFVNSNYESIIQGLKKDS